MSANEYITNYCALFKMYGKNVIEANDIKICKHLNETVDEPTGFLKPTLLSDTLCDFLSIPHGSKKSRDDVTKFISQYIKDYNLEDTTNKRYINPDEKLKALLKYEDPVKESDRLSYFNLPKYMSSHYLR